MIYYAAVKIIFTKINNLLKCLKSNSTVQEEICRENVLQRKRRVEGTVIVAINNSNKIILIKVIRLYYFYNDIKSPFKITRGLSSENIWQSQYMVIKSQNPALGLASPCLSQLGLPRSSVCLVHSSLAPTLPLSFPTFPWPPP